MFRAESESEKPLEGTSRSESPINSFPLAASPGKHPASLTGCSAPLLLSDRRIPACSPSPSHCPLPCRKAGGLDTEEEGKPSTGTRNAQGTLRPTARPPSERWAQGRSQARTPRSSSYCPLRWDCAELPTFLRIYPAGRKREPGGVYTRAERSPCTPGRGASRHPLAPRAPASGTRVPPRYSPFPPPPPPSEPSPPGPVPLLPHPGPPARALNNQPALLAPSCLHATPGAG